MKKLSVLTLITFSLSYTFQTIAEPQSSTSQPQVKTEQAKTENAAPQNSIQTKDSVQSNSSVAEKNLKEGETFLQDNKKKPGIVSLPSGLQYKIVQAGKGQSPGPNDYVSVNYKGTFINGDEFESSYKTGKPATFSLNQVIPAWREALRLMKPGSKWVIYAPAKLAYGERGVRPIIGPNSVLVFDIELLSINPAADDVRRGTAEDWEGSPLD